MAKRKQSPIYTQPRVNVTREQVESVLSSGFYSGITYWAGDSMETINTDSRVSLEENFMRYGFRIRDLEGETPYKRRIRHVTPERIKRAVQLMANEYPHHFNAMLTGNSDMFTGDVLIQLAVFKDVIYG